ncbi:MAG: polysaccharide deacetylase family protein [Gemmatimonadales bacterium]|nr:polysaccharide deacetylase family protein [Gemmatimonadales bacterium]
MNASPDIITIDVEEWFHGHNYLEAVRPEDWDTRESRVEKGMQICFDLLDRYQVKATFFVLGWTARRHPDLIRETVRRGHEIGCHSYSHPVVYEMTPDEFKADTEQALDTLAAAGTTEVLGYRAPSFSITPPVHRYLEILQDLGFQYDCSIFPVHHPRYGQPDSPRHAFKLDDQRDSLIGIPMPTWRFLGLNIPFSGGGYLRWLPQPAFSVLRSGARRQGIPCIVYAHPWELDDFRPQSAVGKTTSLRSQGGQATMPRKLEAVLSEGEFLTLGQYADQLRKLGNLPVWPGHAE